MNAYFKTFLFLFSFSVFFGGVSLSQAKTIFDHQGLEHEVLFVEPALDNNSVRGMSSAEHDHDGLSNHPQSYGHICYPWVWNLGAWYHHHVFWNNFGGWQHGYFRAMYTYQQFFNRYVWVCTWNGCNAIRF